MTNGNPVPYDSNTSQNWLTVVDSWPWTGNKEDGWIKQGECPRCLDHMDKRLTPVQTEYLKSDMRSLTDPESKYVYVACNCPVAHPDTPSGCSGCGQAGRFAAPWAQ